MDYDDELELALTELLSREVAAAPSGPATAGTFFRYLAEQFTGTREAFLAHVGREAPGWFPCVRERPRWLQSEEWKWGSDGRPMTFLGQLDLPRTSTAFPWDSSVYVFLDRRTGEIGTVLQRS